MLNPIHMADNTINTQCVEIIKNRPELKLVLIFVLSFLTGCAANPKTIEQSQSTQIKEPEKGQVEYIPVCDPQKSQIVLGVQQVVTPTGKISIYCNEADTNVNEGKEFITSPADTKYRQHPNQKTITRYRVIIEGKVHVVARTEKSYQSSLESDAKQMVLNGDQNSLEQSQSESIGLIPGTELDQKLEYRRIEETKLFIVDEKSARK